MQGKGSLYSTEGFYSGAFHNDERVGYGKIEYSDSITLSGEFALPGRNQADTESKDEKVNPYSRRLPNGEVHITFANADEYNGEMRDGNISGKGTYRFAMEQ